MFAYIIIYRGALAHVFAKPIAKMLDSAKVMVCQIVIQCIHGISCKKGSAIRLILKINS